jgi:hypothetical protein
VTDGSSPDPCNVEYRGPGAESENETQNILRYVIGTQGAGGTYSGGIFTDRRTDTGTAPSDFRGMFLDIHSFSQLVLWPWAYTATDAPNAPALQTLGRRLAYFNNYRPVQWNGLYLADGTNTDTVYGTTGAPSYTIELGQEFFEDCSTFESSTYPQNFNALKYAARNLQEPYLSPSGPDTTSDGRVRGGDHARAGVRRFGLCRRRTLQPIQRYRSGAVHRERDGLARPRALERRHQPSPCARAMVPSTAAANSLR